jgi:toxin YoeB
MFKNWSDEAWEDYLYWQGEDRKTLRKINDLLKDIERNGESAGIGHPEPLRGNMSGLWSRRIDEKNRLVYKVTDNTIDIIICREHYGR